MLLPASWLGRARKYTHRVARAKDGVYCPAWAFIRKIREVEGEKDEEGARAHA